MMAHYRPKVTRVLRDRVRTKAMLMKLTGCTVRSMVQATARGRAHNEFIFNAILVFMAGAFPLRRLRTFDEVVMMNGKEREEAKTDRYRHEPGLGQPCCRS